MCGIAGAIGAIDAELRGAVERATAAQAHRGPDADGLWARVPVGPGAVFGHRRLAIIDLSDDGRQPMRDPETGNVVCFNGEIYNFRELRAELEAGGAAFHTRTDTEVLLRAYARWGREGLARLRGMFAFALWDESSREVLLARDRLGIKPLYLCPLERPGGGRAWLFASELRGLLAGGLVERRLDPQAVSSYLWNGFVVGPQTILRGVRLLPPGHALVVGESGRAEPSRPFWGLPRAASPPVRDPAALERALEEAVRLRLVSDVPLGIFLSGGIDSSALAALAVRAGGGPVRTFTIGFEEAGFDESPHARAVAAGLGTEHQEIRLRQETFERQLEDALGSIDQPTFDAVNTYFVSRAVREAGITVALSGAGGDELFGGYDSFRQLPRVAPWARLAGRLPAPLVRAAADLAARAVLGRAGALPPQTRWGKLGDALVTGGDRVGLYQVAYGLFTRAFRREIVAADEPEGYLGVPETRAAELRALVAGEPDLHAVSLLELCSFVGERLLRDMDAASMAVSLELRVPLLDHEVVERCAALAPDRRFAPLGRKRLLRELALRDLDPALFERPKAGFELPFEAWCRDRLAGPVEGALLDAARCRDAGLEPAAVARLWQAFRAGAPGIYWSRIWALFVLLEWCRSHRVAL